MAIDHSKLKLELQNLQNVTELSEAEMREAFVQIKELKSFINDSVVTELEKRLTIEAKYKGFLKEKQKIYDILKRLYLANDVTKLLDISQDIKELVKAESISLYILDENEALGKFLKPLVWDNHILSHPEIAKHTVLIDSTDFAAYTAINGRTIRATDFANEKGFSKRYKEQLKFPLKCILSVPIKHDTEVIGVLEVYNKIAKRDGNQSIFTLEDQEILQKISEHISIAITKLSLIQYDPLTGLLRPDPFVDKVILKLRSESKRQQEDVSYAMVMGDVDWFKNYNDRNGHEAGNNLLRDLAGILKSSIREEDLLCRYGGEEFLFFMSNINSREEALVITERIRKNVEKFYFEFQEFQPRNNLTMSFGITNFTKARFNTVDTIDKSEIKKIANEADLAMSEAKGKRISDNGLAGENEIAATKNRICIYYKRSSGDTKVKDVIMPYTEIYAQERRKYQRFFTSTILIYKINGVPFVSKTINLSLGGSKISTEKQLNKDDVVDITLLLGNKACQCDALVVYSERESGNLPFFHSGLRFGALAYNDRKVLEDYFTALATAEPSTSQ
jgi:diguanylate cyclase (GGDEF)-like protein